VEHIQGLAEVTEEITTMLGTVLEVALEVIQAMVAREEGVATMEQLVLVEQVAVVLTAFPFLTSRGLLVAELGF
jgi:hypothetical protein